MGKKKFRIMAVRYGYAEVAADAENEALEISQKLNPNEFDWSDCDSHQVVEEIDY